MFFCKSAVGFCILFSTSLVSIPTFKKVTALFRIFSPKIVSISFHWEAYFSSLPVLWWAFLKVCKCPALHHPLSFSMNALFQDGFNEGHGPSLVWWSSPSHCVHWGFLKDSFCVLLSWLLLLFQNFLLSSIRCLRSTLWDQELLLPSREFDVWNSIMALSSLLVVILPKKNDFPSLGNPEQQIVSLIGCMWGHGSCGHVWSRK